MGRLKGTDRVPDLLPALSVCRVGRDPTAATIGCKTLYGGRGCPHGLREAFAKTRQCRSSVSFRSMKPLLVPGISCRVCNVYRQQVSRCLFTSFPWTEEDPARTSRHSAVAGSKTARSQRCPLVPEKHSSGRSGNIVHVRDKSMTPSTISNDT